MDIGAFFVVSGPIGNMSDITYRAVEVLSKCDLILSEDTRETDKLLNHYQLKGSQLSYRDQNHQRILPVIKEKLEQGLSVALVSDSGTPLISDPGFKLISELVRAGIRITPVPGPSAVTTALSVSGLPTDKFVFLGFLPKGKNQRLSILTDYGKLDATLIIYESPFRVKKLLEETREALGNRTVTIAKDLTKVFENITTAKVDDILKTPEQIKEKGEYVILIAKEGF